MNSAYLIEFSDFFNNFQNVISNYAILITAVGTLSMAFVEAFKSLFKIKGRYLKYKIEKWLKNNNSFSINEKQAMDELLWLAAGDHEDNIPLDWWDQPEEQFFMRIHSAAETAIDFPTAYPNIFNKLSQGLTGATEWHDNANTFRSEFNSTSDYSRLNNLAGIRTRIGSAVSRRLDTLQLQVEWYWAKMNQLSALAVCIIIFIIFSQSYQIGLISAVITGIIAGLLAPFAKDLVSRISGIKLQNR